MTLISQKKELNHKIICKIYNNFNYNLKGGVFKNNNNKKVKV